MNLNKTYYIVEELVEAGLVTKDNFDKVTAIIDKGAEFNKKYQTKKTIYDYLSYYSSVIFKQVDVDAVMSLINSKYKEDAKLTKEDIKLQVINYLKSNKTYKFEQEESFSILVDSIFKQKITYPGLFVRF
jgi:hypothetical protein